VSKAKAVSRRERVVVRKEGAKDGRAKKPPMRRECKRACRAKRALAKAKETTMDLGEEEGIKEKEEENKEIGMIGGRVFLVVIATPMVEELRVGMPSPREDKVTVMMAGLVRGAILARAVAMLSTHYQQMIAE